LDRAAHLLRSGHRLDIVGYSVQLASTGAQHYADFAEICKIAKMTKVVTLTVPSAELGTPFNEEVEHLKRLVEIAAVEGARVGVKTELGRLSEDPDTLMVLCNNIEGLGITLDPSVFIVGPAKNKTLDRILKFVYHVHLRDTKPDKFQVSVGQGSVDYAKLIRSSNAKNTTARCRSTFRRWKGWSIASSCASCAVCSNRCSEFAPAGTHVTSIPLPIPIGGPAGAIVTMASAFGRSRAPPRRQHLLTRHVAG
jgi:hypothetical protein